MQSVILVSAAVWMVEGALAAAPPAPPRQTPFQQGLVARVNASARASSAEATPILIGLLNDQGFRSHLRSCCPAIADKPGTELLGLLKEGIRTAELTHNFHANSSGTWEGDVNMTTAPEVPWLPNLWEIIYLNIEPEVEMREEDTAEVNLMGFRPFPVGPVGNATPSTRAEAAERPTYTTIDLLHLAEGNDAFGDISLVFRPSYAQPLALLAPMDTGNWEDWCNTSSGGPAQCDHYPFAVNCTAWDRSQGTFAHPEHVILANIRLWDGSACANATGGMLPRIFSMLFGESTQDHTLSHPAQRNTFIEANLAGTVLYPEGVKLIVGTAQTLFGSVFGLQLRRWCAAQGWALLWGLGTSNDPAWWAAGHAVLGHRVVDPHASSSLNLTVSSASVAAFDAQWAAVAKARANSTVDTIDWAGSLWPKLPEALGVSSGLWPGQCADIDSCVGHANGDCVCYK